MSVKVDRLRARLGFAVGKRWRALLESQPSPCDFLSAEAVAVLAGFVQFRRARGMETRLLLDTLRLEVRKNLWKMGLLELFGERPCPAHENSLPLYQQETYDREAIVRYIEREVMFRAEMPLMSKDLRKEIRRSFVEIFGNVFHHSESVIGALCAGRSIRSAKKSSSRFLTPARGSEETSGRA